MATKIEFRNASVTNSVRMTPQDAITVPDPKDDKKTIRKGWRAGLTSIVKPNEHAGFYLGPNNRVTIEEIPT